MRSTIRSLSAADSRAGINSITRASEFMRANGSRSRASQFLSSRRSVLMIVVPSLIFRFPLHGPRDRDDGAKASNVKIVLRTFCWIRGLFTRDALKHYVSFQQLSFGFWRALYKSVRGRKAEDPFRGLRAGPASFPRPLPPSVTSAYPFQCAAGCAPSLAVRLNSRTGIFPMRIHASATFV